MHIYDETGFCFECDKEQCDETGFCFECDKEQCDKEQCDKEQCDETDKTAQRLQEHTP